MIAGQLALPEPAWHTDDSVQLVELTFAATDEELLALYKAQKQWDDFHFGPWSKAAGSFTYHGYFTARERNDRFSRAKAAEYWIAREICNRFANLLATKKGAL